MTDLMDLNPVLLRVNRFEGYSTGEAKTTPPRRIYDFELELIERCDGCMRIDNDFVHFVPGDICVRKPGMFTYGVLPYQSILVCADLFGNTSKSAGYVLGDALHAQSIDDIKIISRMPVKIPAAACTYAGRLITSLLEASSYATDIHRLRVKSLLMQVICELCAATARPSVSSDCADSSFPAVLAYIDEKLDSELRVSELVELSGISRATFFRMFEARTGFSPGTYIERRRMERARALLELGGSELPVQTVAERCGYFDASYFCRVFHEYTGMTPAKYREAAGGSVENVDAAQP